MPQNQPADTPAADAPASAGARTTATVSAAQREPAAHEMECPVCGSAMPDLKGGKATICLTCGFKDSCCF